MPITQSAKKALRQNIRRRVQNVRKMDAVKSAVKKYKKLASEKKTAEAEKQLSLVYKAIDKAVKTNSLNRNKGSRMKSRLAKLAR
ncbi:MAG: 30S ribosomal protein S20 [Candidatus Liptonbacteria bacterium]|nr:30S ribosomal protein S20 [Candidatus Liptonbacteria bacterium]